MLAKNARTTRAFRQQALSLTSIASKLAPTGFNASWSISVFAQTEHVHSIFSPPVPALSNPVFHLYG